MITKVIAVLAVWTTGVISSLGYGGVALLMAIESACIPLPSEIIMPFAGYLVYTGQFSLHGAALAGAVGCIVGSIPAYWLGQYGGRPVIERWGRYVLLSRKELDLADRLFARHGQWVVLVGRLLPVVRTFIAFPAGVARMNMTKFVVYTFVGSYPWCYGLAWVGMKLGEQWDKDPRLKAAFHRFDLVIGLALVAAAAWFVWHKLREAKASRAPAPAAREGAGEG
ncbi:DedA family protein [Anaeromyxobacter diazotrophicus]|uniref:Alkaline phosphatase n=1 Tax=Anaeromyxobacter diazotrophicus TaxID=2590199 RepID=A0A7I9VND8_9BACT|nr:DedA family protein [Anaeromyxobacter diazotrophicus]GEJ57924.1 alkaline phosphatase [Anaeromyxobacter diazotrophicus]